MEVTKERKEEILQKLRERYIDKEDRGGLIFNSPYEALIAVMLSAQCTDERVNQVTAELFKEYNTPEKMITLSEEELKGYIKSVGLTNSKAKNVLAASKKLIEEFNSEVPRTKEEILTLPGVGNKTANVVLSNVYGVPGLGVDTHVKRVSNRLGLATGNNPDKVEKELCELIPEEYWMKAHHWLLWHGREYCKSRKPDCHNCPVKDQCKYFQELNQTQENNVDIEA